MAMVNNQAPRQACRGRHICSVRGAQSIRAASSSLYETSSHHSDACFRAFRSQRGPGRFVHAGACPTPAGQPFPLRPIRPRWACELRRVPGPVPGGTQRRCRRTRRRPTASTRLGAGCASRDRDCRTHWRTAPASRGIRDRCRGHQRSGCGHAAGAESVRSRAPGSWHQRTGAPRGTRLDAYTVAARKSPAMKTSGPASTNASAPGSPQADER